MQYLQSMLSLLGEYPTWAKVGMLASLSCFVAFVVFGHRPTESLADSKVSETNGDDADSDTDRQDTAGKAEEKQAAQQDGESAAEKAPENQKKRKLLQTVDTATTGREIQEAARSAPEELAEHIQETGLRNDELAYVTDLRCEGRSFDIMVYSYNSPANQNPHYLYLLDFYEPNSLQLSQLDEDWEAVESIEFQDLKAALSEVAGFSAPLEVVGGFTKEIYTPALIYVQVAGRRDGLTPKEIEELRSRFVFERKDIKKMHRISVTYDTLVEGGLAR